MGMCTQIASSAFRSARGAITPPVSQIVSQILFPSKVFLDGAAGSNRLSGTSIAANSSLISGLVSRVGLVTTHLGLFQTY